MFLFSLFFTVEEAAEARQKKGGLIIFMRSFHFHRQESQEAFPKIDMYMRCLNFCNSYILYECICCYKKKLYHWWICIRTWELYSWLKCWCISIDIFVVNLISTIKLRHWRIFRKYSESYIHRLFNFNINKLFYTPYMTLQFFPAIKLHGSRIFIKYWKVHSFITFHIQLLIIIFFPRVFFLKTSCINDKFLIKHEWFYSSLTFFFQH